MKFYQRIFVFRQSRFILVVVSLLLVGLTACQKRVQLWDEIEPENINTTKSNQEVSVAFSSTFAKPTISHGNSLRAFNVNELKLQDYLNFNKVRIVFYSYDPIEDKPLTVKYVFDKDVKATGPKGLSGTDLDVSEAVENTPSGGIESVGTQNQTDEYVIKIKGSEKIKVDNYAVYFFTSPSEDLKKVTSVGSTFEALKQPLNATIIPDLYTRYATYTNVEEPLILSLENLAKTASEEVFSIQSPKLKSLDGLAYVNFENFDLDGYTLCFEYIYAYPDVENRTQLLFPEVAEIETANGEEVKYYVDNNYEHFRSKNVKELERYFEYASTDFIPLGNRKINRTILTIPSKKRIESDKKTGKKLYLQHLSIPIHENTMSGEDVYGTTTTRLILACPLYPNELKDKYKDKIDDPTGGIIPAWVQYKGKNYMLDEFKSMHEEVFNKAKKKAPLTASDTELLTAGNLLTLNKSKNTSKNWLELKYPSHPFDSDLVKLYNGYAFYAIPIRHATDEQLPQRGATGRYGVVRNTLYYYNIKSFSKLGAPTIESLSRNIGYDEEIQGGLSLTVQEPDIIVRNITL